MHEQVFDTNKTSETPLVRTATSLNTHPLNQWPSYLSLMKHDFPYPSYRAQLYSTDQYHKMKKIPAGGVEVPFLLFLALSTEFQRFNLA